MKTKLLSLLAGVSFSFLVVGCNSSLSSHEEALPSPAEAGTQLYGPEDTQLIQALKLNLEERTQILKELRANMTKHYVLYSLKKDLIGISSDEIFDQCEADNQKTLEPMPRFQFHSFVSRCMSRLQDSHLALNLSNQAARVSSMLRSLSKIQDKYVISRVNTDMMDYWISQDALNSDLQKWLVPGTEVVELDDKPTAQAMTEWSQLIGEGSPSAREFTALFSFFERTSEYPTQSYMRIKLKNDQEEKVFDLPWFFSPSRYSTEVNVHLTQLGLINSKRLNKEFGAMVGTAWYNPAWAAGDLLGGQTYTVESGTDALTTGIVWDSKPFCYMNLSTFMLNPTVKDKNKNDVSFIKTLKAFLISCENKKLPLVIDVKDNSGGDSNYALAISELLVPKEKRNHFLRSSKTAQGTLSLIESMVEMDQENSGASLNSNMKSALSRALQTNSAFLPWLQHESYLEANDVVFNQKIITLISPHCVSACEVFSQLLKKADRSVFMGQETAGTGAGFLSTSTQSTVFTDSFKVLKINIPNFLFTIGILPENSKFMDFDPSMLIENRALQPDIPYEITLNDVQNKWQDLKVKVTEELYQNQ